MYDQLPVGADAEAAAAAVVHDVVVEDMVADVGSTGDRVVTITPVLDYSSLAFHHLLMDGRPSPKCTVTYVSYTTHNGTQTRETQEQTISY